MVTQKANRNSEAPLRDLGMEAYEKLKGAIRDGVYPSGTRLTEAEVSEWLGMSRTPIREALHRLETDGLLEHEPRRGLVVSRPDHRTIVELYVMREALEGTAAGLAARHAGEAEVQAMAKLVDAENGAVDGASLSALNNRLHRLIHVSANNRFLLRSLSVLSDTMALLPTLLNNKDRAAQAHVEHRAIVEAIAAGDGAAAEAAMRLHLRSAQRQRVATLVQ